MKITEKQYEEANDTCECCGNCAEDPCPGRCNRCKIGLRLTAYVDKKDTKDYYWHEDYEKFIFDYGEWRLKK